MATYPTHNPPASSRAYRSSWGAKGSNSWWGGMTLNAQQTKIGRDSMNMLGTYVQGKSDIEVAGYKRFGGEAQARLMLRNADARYAEGTREAGEIARQGRKGESDMIAAMVAQGGTVDPTMIAMLKQRTTYNSMSAIFDATRESEGMKLEASIIRDTVRINEGIAKRNAQTQNFGAALKLGTTLVGAWG